MLTSDCGRKRCRAAKSRRAVTAQAIVNSLKANTMPATGAAVAARLLGRALGDRVQPRDEARHPLGIAGVSLAERSERLALFLELMQPDSTTTS